MLTEAAAKAVESLYGTAAAPGQLQVQETRKDFEGDRTLVVFPLLKISSKKPEVTGEEIGKWLVENVAEIAAYNVVKGFLNLSISQQFWVNQLNEARNTTAFGSQPASGKSVMLEYSSPNTNKPLHLGHVRNILLGWSVTKLLESQGHKVVKTQIINDRGVHICKSMLAWQKFGEGATPESTGQKGDKLVGAFYVLFNQKYTAQVQELVANGVEQERAEAEAPLLVEAKEMLRKWEAGDPAVTELWKMMNSWVYQGFDVTYQNLGVAFDTLYYESNTWRVGKEKVQKGLADGIFTKRDDGSVWCEFDASEKFDPKVLLRSDGTALYMTQDIGTAILRSEEYPDVSSFIYTVGNEQDHHFKLLFRILKKLGYEWSDQCYHLSYGMVELPDGKMKSREGTVVDADDLMAEMQKEARSETADRVGDKLNELSEEELNDLYRILGMGALKFFILKVDPRKKMLFDPKESISFTGNTGPFIQYTHARIKSLLRNEGNPSGDAALPQDGLSEAEQELIKAIYRFPAVLTEAAKHMQPALVATYAFALAQDFNGFYQNSQPRIKDDSDAVRKNFRLALSAMVATVIASSMDVLGIEVPERM